MYLGFLAFIFSVGVVALAEMGDKSQLLAMAFVSKYKPSKVLIGIGIATLLNNGIAVAIGNMLTKYTSAQIWIQCLASLSFILFGLWTLKGENEEVEENKKTRFGAITTVAITFFIGEFGDKTQLAAIALATKFPHNPIEILLGTTFGMLIADSIGILFGVAMCKKIPKRTVQFISAGVFILFGIIGSFETLKNSLNMEMSQVLGIIAGLIIATGIASYYLIKDSHDEKYVIAKYCKEKDK